MVSSPIWTLPAQVQVRLSRSGSFSRAAVRVTVLNTDPGVKVEDRKRLQISALDTGRWSSMIRRDVQRDHSWGHETMHRISPVL